MSRDTPHELAAEARRVNLEQLARLGGELRRARRRRGLSQQGVGGQVGLSQATVSRAERGFGGGLTLDAWQRVAHAVGRPLRCSLDGDAEHEPADSGHLAIQELLLRLGRQHGYGRTFELGTKPSDPSRSVDVGWRDDRGRALILLEAINTLGDIGASVRSSDRKAAEAEQLAVAIGGDRPYRVTTCWVMRDTTRNRGLVQRYPELFGTRFPGSSHAWSQAITSGSTPPHARGLVWCDLRATRIFPWRRRAAPGASDR